MLRWLRRMGQVAAVGATLLLGGLAGAQERAVQPTTDVPEVWSLDDVHDVFESVQFLAITVGIGVAVYWYFRRYEPRTRVPRFNFTVDVRRVGSQGGAALIEVVAEVENVGSVPVELTGLRFRISAVTIAEGQEPTGPLSEANGTAALFEGSWSESRALVEPGVCRVFVSPAAVPASVTHVVVTGPLSAAGERRPRTMSRLVAIG